MTEFEIVSNIENLVTSNEGVTNTLLRKDQILLDIDSMRIRLIAEAEKALMFRKPYQGFGQKISSLDVQRAADKSLYVDIPRIFIDHTGKPAVGYIGGKDESTPYRIITGNQIISDDPYIASYPAVHYSDGRLTFKNATPPSKIMLRDTVFEDPSALEVYGEYDPETSSYPLPSSVIDILIGKVADGYLRTMYRKAPQPNTQTDLPATAAAK
jgi:hypothetical protein